MNRKTEYQRKNGSIVYGRPNITAKTTLEEIEAAEKNQNWFINHQLDGMAERGEISLENPPNIWAIVKANGIELAVKGMSFGNRQEALKRLAAYNPAMVRAVLVPEPENKQDPAAVAVMVGVQGGKGLFRLGYIPRDMTAVAAVLGSKLPALRVVCGTWGFSNQVTFGARVALAV